MGYDGGYSGGTGQIYSGTSQLNSFSNYGSSNPYSEYYTRPSAKEFLKQQKLALKAQQQQQKQWKKNTELRKKNWTLADLSEYKKEDIRDTFKQLLHERWWDEMNSGIKWFLLFLGMALFLNFKMILTVIQSIVK